MEGAITYHFGNSKLNEVAMVNAALVCPEGKDKEPALEYLTISLWLENGRSLRIASFNEVVMIPVTNSEEAIE